MYLFSILGFALTGDPTVKVVTCLCPDVAGCSLLRLNWKFVFRTLSCLAPSGILIVASGWLTRCGTWCLCSVLLHRNPQFEWKGQPGGGAGSSPLALPQTSCGGEQVLFPPLLTGLPGWEGALHWPMSPVALTSVPFPAVSCCTPISQLLCLPWKLWFVSLLQVNGQLNVSQKA